MLVRVYGRDTSGNKISHFAFSDSSGGFANVSASGILFSAARPAESQQKPRDPSDVYVLCSGSIVAPFVQRDSEMLDVGDAAWRGARLSANPQVTAFP